MFKVANIEINNPSEFLKDFLSLYLEAGFARMNKTDLEYLLFFLFVKNECFKGMSNFDIGLLLKIPESKVRRLKYEAELRYGKHENSDEVLLAYLINCRSEYSKESIKISFEDKFLQSLFVSELKKSVNSISDYTNNPEIVTVTKNAFIKFITTKYCQFQYDPFMDEYEEADIKKDDGEMGIHYCIRLLIEKSKPLSSVLSTLSSVYHGKAESKELLALL